MFHMALLSTAVYLHTCWVWIGSPHGIVLLIFSGESLVNLYSNDCVLLLLFCQKSPLHSRRVATVLLCFCGWLLRHSGGHLGCALTCNLVGSVEHMHQDIAMPRISHLAEFFSSLALKMCPMEKNNSPTKEGHYFWCIPLWLASCCYRRPCCFADGIKSLYKLSQMHLNCNEVHLH